MDVNLSLNERVKEAIDGASNWFVIDLFAGPGGWSHGIADIIETEVGFEINDDAIATAQAAGFMRLKGDLSQEDPCRWALAGRGRLGLIASPPCQGFSTAGKGRGREDAEALMAGIRQLIHGPMTGGAVDDLIASLKGTMKDPRSTLVLEPLRWALYLRPEWIALEQVPSVLPVWNAMAEVLRVAGYSVDTGTLSAEQYGVPQVRKRAILVARNSRMTMQFGPAMLPMPTHSAFYSRSPERLDEGLERWISMGEAIEGWMNDELVGFPRKADGRGGEVVIDGVPYRARDLRPTHQPAQTVTEKSRSWKRYVPTFNDQSGTAYDPEWPFKRPSTTVAGRGLVQNPGATANRHNGSTKSRNDGVKVTVAEAGILQSFPGNYPWRGSQTSQYQRAGDAVPPLLARAIVSEVSGMIQTQQRMAANEYRMV